MRRMEVVRSVRVVERRERWAFRLVIWDWVWEVMSLRERVGACFGVEGLLGWETGRGGRVVLR